VLSKPIPGWISASAFALAWTAGSINAVGFLGLRHGLSHMSGPVTSLGDELAGGNLPQALEIFLVIASFFIGCTLSSLIIGHGLLRLSRSYGVVLLVESLSLLTAWWFFSRERYGGECLASLACGLQNAMVSSYSGAVIRTTHVTGIITDLGIVAGQLLRGRSLDRRRTGLYLVLLSGFFVGGICGSIGFGRIGYGMLLLPAALTGTAGILYLLIGKPSVAAT